MKKNTYFQSNEAQKPKLISSEKVKTKGKNKTIHSADGCKIITKYELK